MLVMGSMILSFHVMRKLWNSASVYPLTFSFWRDKWVKWCPDCATVTQSDWWWRNVVFTLFVPEWANFPKSGVCLSVCLSVRVICECENWVLCCAALGEVKLHSGASMGATKLHSCHWMAVFYNQALVIPTPLERLYELPLSLPWYARPHPAKTQMVGLTKKRHKTHLHGNTEGIRDSPLSKDPQFSSRS